jgi:hypothetical protein
LGPGYVRLGNPVKTSGLSPILTRLILVRNRTLVRFGAFVR